MGASFQDLTPEIKITVAENSERHFMTPTYIHRLNLGVNTRDVFYVRREVDLMKTAKVNAYIMHIFGKIEVLSIHAI